MKKFISILLSIFILVSMFTITVSANTEKAITVVFSHDMHSYLDTAKDNTGGFARIKTIIDQAKAQDPATFVVDGGDFAMGTLYQSIFSSYATEFRLLGFMGYDAVTLGNHEFDYGADGLAQMLTSAKNSGDALPQLLCANINWESSTGKYTNDLKKALEGVNAKDYTVIEKNGVKAAIFGVMGREADEYAPNSGLEFYDINTKAAEIVAQIKKNEKADIIICLSHSGTSDDEDTSEDVQLAKAVPEIDLIISGHSHTTLDEPLVIGDTVIASCGEYGKKVGKVKLSSSASGDWKVDSYDLIATDSSIKDDEATLKKISEFRGFTGTYLEQFGFTGADQVIAHSSYDMSDVQSFYTDHVEHGMGYLITDSYIEAVKKAEGENYIPVDVAVVPSGVMRSTFLTGDITVSDAYEVSSLGIGLDGVPGYPLISIYLTGKELKTAAEVDASVSVLMNSARLFFSGLQYTFNPNRLILNRITDVALVKDGERVELEDDKLYRVVADYYSGQMLGTVKEQSFNLLSLEPKDANGNVLSSYDDCIIYNGDMELKAWYALASYVDSLDELPEIYNTPQGRKNISNSKNVIELVKNPNKIAFIVLGVIIALILIIVIIVIVIIKLVKKAKNKKRAQSQA